MKITNILTENVSFKGIYTYDLYSGALAREARQRSTMGKKIW